jgi:hypothetical protein
MSYSCERMRARLDELLDQYTIDLDLEKDETQTVTLNFTVPRTPLRKISSNTTTPHRPATMGKTPGTTGKFAAELQAIRDAYPKLGTPTFSPVKDFGSSPIRGASPLVQKSCPPKQVGRGMGEVDPALGLRKKLFGGGVRKSMGTTLGMRFDDEE